MTAGGTAIKARGCPPIFFENRCPPRPLRGAALRSAALTAAPPPVPRTPFSMMRTQTLEVMMSMYQSIGTASARKSVVSGKRVSVRGDLGGRRIFKQKTNITEEQQ